MRKVVGNGIYISPAILEKITERMTHPLEETPESTLSNREMQVLIQLSRGASSGKWPNISA